MNFPSQSDVENTLIAKRNNLNKQIAKYLIFKSCRGLDRPWLVFNPTQRSNPSESQWSEGFATWQEAIASIK